MVAMKPFVEGMGLAGARNSRSSRRIRCYPRVFRLSKCPQFRQPGRAPGLCSGRCATVRPFPPGRRLGRQTRSVP
jgi:hypothetical protein